MPNRKYFPNENIKFTYDILDSMVDWVRVVDRNGYVIFTNKSMMNDVGNNNLESCCYESIGKNHPCNVCITKATMLTGSVTEKEEIINDRIYSVKSAPIRNDNDEIYAAVEVFRDVTRERKLEREILEANRIMRDDLEFSRKLQRKVLPSKGEYGSLKIDYIYEASESLSGDMFDVFKIDDRYTGIYVSDVVGHGVTASMMTMFIRQTMRSLKDYYIQPGKVISELHKKFLELQLDDDKYFTIFYGILDCADNTFTYANGGHNCIPLLITDETVKLLKVTGYPVSSLFGSILYEEESIKFEVGNKLLLYTDGIIEAKNKYGEQFGLERLRELAKDRDNNIIEVIKKYAKDYGFNTKEDDFAVIKAKFVREEETKNFFY